MLNRAFRIQRRAGSIQRGVERITGARRARPGGEVRRNTKRLITEAAAAASAAASGIYYYFKPKGVMDVDRPAANQVKVEYVPVKKYTMKRYNKGRRYYVKSRKPYKAIRTAKSYAPKLGRFTLCPLTMPLYLKYQWNAEIKMTAVSTFWNIKAEEFVTNRPKYIHSGVATEKCTGTDEWTAMYDRGLIWGSSTAIEAIGQASGVTHKIAIINSPVSIADQIQLDSNRGKMSELLSQPNTYKIILSGLSGNATSTHKTVSQSVSKMHSLTSKQLESDRNFVFNTEGVDEAKYGPSNKSFMTICYEATGSGETQVEGGVKIRMITTFYGKWFERKHTIGLATS